MNIRIRVHIIIILFIVAMIPFETIAQQRDIHPKWEQIATAPPVADSSRINSDNAANVSVQDMYIYIELEQPASVKLFTILGQPVSQVQLPAGTSRYKVSARGIYILKIGSVTRRVTI